MSRSPLLLATVLLLSVVAVSTPAAAQETVTLTVSVVDQNGDAVGDANITATWDGGQTTATTASNGKAFVDVPHGVDVRLRITHDEYVRNVPYVVEDARSQDVTVEVARQGRLTIVTTSEGEPLSGVHITLQKDGNTIVENETGEDGTFTTGIIEQGRYFVRLYEPGYYRNATYVEVNESASATFSMVEGTTTVEFQVVDDHFEQPNVLTDAQVTVRGIGTLRTSAGTVTFTVEVNRYYTVSATGDGYQTNETQFFVGTDEARKTLVINRQDALTVEPHSDRIVVGERVTVTVTNAYNETVEGATVLLDGQQVATTDEDGQARFAIENAGAHEIVAKANGVTSAVVNVTGVAVNDDGETVTATETAATTETVGTEPLPLPGFTPAVAVLAVLAGALLFARR